MDILNYKFENSDWISVKDRLPESGENNVVMLYSPQYGVFAGNYSEDYFANKKCQHWNDDKGYDSSTLDFEVVTHWQPLPEPPKDGE